MKLRFRFHHLLIACAVFALFNRLFLSPYFWLAFYPWLWLVRAEGVFSEVPNPRQGFDIVLLISGVSVQLLAFSGVVAWLMDRGMKK